MIDLSKLSGVESGLNGSLAAAIFIMSKVDSKVLWHISAWTIGMVMLVHFSRAGHALWMALQRFRKPVYDIT